MIKSEKKRENNSEDPFAITTYQKVWWWSLGFSSAALVVAITALAVQVLT